LRVGAKNSKQFYMKKLNLLFVSFLFITSINFAQDVIQNDSSKLFDVNKIENYVFGKDIDGFSIFVDNNDDIVFTKTIQDIKLSKDDIYNRALSFFITNYKDAKSVLQQQDKDAGIIIGKGVFSDFHCSKGTFKYLGNKNTVSDFYSAYHIMRIDIKDNKARIIVTVQNYDIKPIFITSNIIASAGSEQAVVTKKIISCQPIDTTSISDRIEIQVSKYNSYKNTYRNYYKSYMPIILESEKAAFVPLCNRVFVTINNLEKELKNQSSKNSENW